MSITSKSRAINGEITASNRVVAIYDNCLGCLVGMVSDIDKFGTLEHKSESGTDDIHVDFTMFNYPAERVNEIADYFNIPFNEADGFDGYPIGAVVLSPDKVFCVEGFSDDEIIRFCKQFEEQNGINQMGCDDGRVNRAAVRAIKLTFPRNGFIIANKQHRRSIETARGTFIHFRQIRRGSDNLDAMGLIVTSG